MSLVRRLGDAFAPRVWSPAPIDGQPRGAALPHYVPGPDFDPGGAHSLLLYAGSRGSGKTEHACRYFCEYMNNHPGTRARIIAPTLGDAIESCVKGLSGILAMDPDADFRPSDPGGSAMLWPNGSRALLLGTLNQSDIERLRAGGNRQLDWWEELSTCGRNGALLDDAWTQAKFGLRNSPTAHSIASTTPKTNAAYMKLHKSASTYRMTGTVFQNPFLSDEFRNELVTYYGDSRIGRQELYGELLEDAEGALFLSRVIETIMRATLVEMQQPEQGGRGTTVLAIDPSIGAGEPNADETGLVVAARTQQTPDTAWILADGSLRGDPGKWARAARDLYNDWSCDYAVAEINQGGQMVKETLQRYCPEMVIRPVWAKKGKMLRAEPVAILAEQGKVRLVGSFPELEDQMTTWEPLSGNDSPDRLDAMVYAVLALLPRGGSGPPKQRKMPFRGR